MSLPDQSDDNELLFNEYDEVFEDIKPFDPYDEYGVNRLDFTWYGNLK